MAELDVSSEVSPLLELLNGFIVELRQAGLPVSLTENLDAVAAVKHIPIEDREAFKYSLAATLVKNHSHWRAFETVFEVYFSLRGEEYNLSEEIPDDASSEDSLSADNPRPINCSVNSLFNPDLVKGLTLVSSSPTTFTLKVL